MTPSQNASLARRWFEEVWNHRRDETVHELMPPEAIGHMEGTDRDTRGPGDFLPAREALLGAFPDLCVVVEDTVAEGNHVVVRWSAKATHRGAHLGFPATSKPVAFRGMTWLRFSDGRIVEGWDSWNEGKLLAELQAPEAPPAPQRRSAVDH